jgi:hypothetical protein
MEEGSRGWLPAAFGAVWLSLGLVGPAGAAPPPNDDFDAAIVVPSVPFSDTQEVGGATMASDDPTSIACPWGGVIYSTWYSFTPTADVLVEASASYVSDVHVYTGSRGSLTEVACALRPSLTPAVVRFTASAGATYHVMIVTYATPPVPAPVTFTLREPPPPPDNDDFDTPRVIPGLPFDDYADTTDATAAPDDPWCYTPGPTIWYSFAPAEDVRVEIDTADSGYPTTLSVFTGRRGALMSLGCSAFNGPGGQARVRFDAKAGETYHVMVGAYFQSYGGPLSFHVRVAPSPFRFALSVDPTGAVRPSTGAATVQGTATCSEPAFIYGNGVLRQDRPGGSIDGWFSIGFFCDGTTAWSASPSYSLQRGRGRSALLYTGGRADVSASAYGFGFNSGETYDTSLTAPVRLTGSR